MHQSTQSIGTIRNKSVFSENFNDDENNIAFDKENIAPYEHSKYSKTMLSTNINNAGHINGFPQQQQQQRSVLGDVTSHVSNKLHTVKSDSTYKSASCSFSPSSTNSNGEHLLKHNKSSSLSKEHTNVQISDGFHVDNIPEHDISIDEKNFDNGLHELSDLSDEEQELQTNEYSGIEPDDNNDKLMTPIRPLANEATDMILSEAHQKYHRDTPDLMDEDTYDVVMVAELANGIFDYLKTLEEKYKPNPNYMHYQKELRWSYRRILLDWIVEVHNRFQLLPETLYLTVNIIDRFLSKKSVLLNKFQLVGAASLFIAAKYEEINCPTLKDIIYMLNNANTKEEIIDAERYIIDSLDFEIGWPGPMSFLRRISKADDYEYEIRTLAKYLLESTIMDSRLISAEPSWLASGAYFLSKVILGYNVWSLKHIYYSGYTQEQVLPLATIILEDCRDASKYHKVILKKYSSRRQHNSAQIVARWIDSAEKKVEDSSNYEYELE